MDRLTRLPCIDVVGSSSLTPSAPGHLVHQLIWEMDQVPLHLIRQPPAVSKAENHKGVVVRCTISYPGWW